MSIFAYGQTGSGKTYTMDGFRYTTPYEQQLAYLTKSINQPLENPPRIMSNASLDMRPPTTGATTRPGTRAGGHPIPLLKDTPAAEIGMLPRAIHTLCERIKNRAHRWTTKLSVSFMQIYR